MKQARKKLHSARGFTLTELLATMLILLLVTAIVAGGIPAALNAYRNVVDAANAQVLLSTEMTVLRDELGLATEVSVDGTTITFRSGNTGSLSRIEVTDDGVLIREYMDEAYTAMLDDGDVSDTLKDTIREAQAGRLIVSRSAATAGMRFSYSAPETGIWNAGKGLFTLEDLTVAKNGKTLTTLGEYKIRAVAVPTSP